MAHPRERFTRRDFLRRSAGAAVAAPSLAALLDACTKPGGGSLEQQVDLLVPRPETPVTLPLIGEPIPTDTPIEQGAELLIYNWDQYLYKYVVRRFVEQNADHDITFNAVTTFTNMDEAIAKMQTGQIEADVVFPTIDAVPRLAVAGLLQPLNHDLIPNLEANVWPVYQDPYYDEGWRYTVPYVVYNTGIAYRRDVVSDEEIRGMANPYSILWDPAHRDRVGVYNSYRDTIQTALLNSGIEDINTGRQQDLDLARDELLSMIDLVNPRATINGAFKLLPRGDFDVHIAWSGDIAAGWGYVNEFTRQEYEKLGYWFPEDRRGNVDNDCIAIPANAPHPRLAHEFINFLLDFTNAMDNFSWVGYQPPQIETDIDSLTSTEGLYSQLSGWAESAEYVLPWMQDAVIRRSDFDVGFRQAPLAPEVDDRWHEVWQQFKTGVSAAG
ncbi:MAG: extracellular solute-binding protein [Actinobacteria bacterium]|nr:extracellular solute-binding protein [Actinomycetota bacterium]